MIGIINLFARGLSLKGFASLSILFVWMIFISGINTLLAADVTLAWDANTEPDVAGYNVYAGITSGSYGPHVSVGNQTSYTVTGLGSGTHYFAVTAYDAYGVESGFSIELSVTINVSSDTTPTVISSVQAISVTSGGATISWNTNEPSTTQVEYGLTTAYGSSTTLLASLVTTHSQSLGVLASGTLYHYRVKSRDAAGNLGISGDFTFTTASPPDTTPPTVTISSPASGATVSGIVTISASASDNVGVVGVQFLLNGSNFGAEDVAAPYSVSWNTLTALNGAHTLSARARDAAGNNTTAANRSANVSNDTTVPTITGVISSSLTSSSASIVWTTNEASNSQVEYGTSTSYGSSTTVNSSMVVTHSQALTGLTASTLYHYRVKSRDAAGNLAISGDFTFTTASPPDTTPPTVTISSPASGATVSGTVTISASASDNVGVTGVQFLLDGANLGAEDVAAPYSVSWNTLTALNGAHTLSARARDAAGNNTTAANRSVNVSNDTTVPTITGVISSSLTSSSASIAWTTNEASNSQVEYGTSTSYGSSTTVNSSMVVSHSQALTGLTASTLYHYRVKSRDSAGNLAVSGDSIFTTTSPPDTTPPTVTISSPAPGATVSGTVTISASASDNNGVTGVQFLLDGANLGAEDVTAPYSVSWNTSTALYGTHALSARARDAAGNQVVAQVTVQSAAPPSSPSASYGFNEGSGTVTADASGPNTGTLSGASWHTLGKFGSALAFNGTNSYVTAGVTGLSNIGSSQTVSWWLTVPSIPTVVQTIISIEGPYAGGAPSAAIYPGFRNSMVGVWKTGGGLLVSATPPSANEWHHYAYTVDGSTHRLYIDGVERASSLQPSGQNGTPNSLQFGRCCGGSQYFSGFLDEVRIYNRALSQAEIQIVMNMPVGAQSAPGISSTYLTEDSPLDQYAAPGLPAFDKTEHTEAPVPATVGVGTSKIQSTETLTAFILTEIEDQGFTQLHLVNPAGDSATITIDLLKADGIQRVAAVTRRVQGNGTLDEFFTDLFPGVVPVASDYIRVSSDQGVVPFQSLGKSSLYVEGLQGQDARGGATTLYSPQYFVGGQRWRSTLSVVNLDSQPGLVTIRFIGDDGTQIGPTNEIPISDKGKIYIPDQSFLDGDDTLIQGYLEITSNGPKLAGSAVFGDQGRSVFFAASPLVSKLHEAVIFSQLASNDIYFTALALINPNDTVAHATIDVFDSEGGLVVTRMVSIPAGERKSQLLTEYFPDLVGQNCSSVSIRVTSDIGLASLALFGAHDLSVLSAVPGQAVP